MQIPETCPWLWFIAGGDRYSYKTSSSDISHNKIQVRDYIQDTTSVMEKKKLMCNWQDKCVFSWKPAHPASNTGMSVFQRI